MGHDYQMNPLLWAMVRSLKDHRKAVNCLGFAQRQ